MRRLQCFLVAPLLPCPSFCVDRSLVTASIAAVHRRLVLSRPRGIFSRFFFFHHSGPFYLLYRCFAAGWEVRYYSVQRTSFSWNMLVYRKFSRGLIEKWDSFYWRTLEWPVNFLASKVLLIEKQSIGAKRHFHLEKHYSIRKRIFIIESVHPPY